MPLAVTGVNLWVQNLGPILNFFEYYKGGVDERKEKICAGAGERAGGAPIQGLIVDWQVEAAFAVDRHGMKMYMSAIKGMFSCRDNCVVGGSLPTRNRDMSAATFRGSDGISCLKPENC